MGSRSDGVQHVGGFDAALEGNGAKTASAGAKQVVVMIQVNDARKVGTRTSKSASPGI